MAIICIFPFACAFFISKLSVSISKFFIVSAEPVITIFLDFTLISPSESIFEVIIFPFEFMLKPLLPAITLEPKLIPAPLLLTSIFIWFAYIPPNCVASISTLLEGLEFVIFPLL